jgi:fatty-acyl-CoA synthase
MDGMMMDFPLTVQMILDRAYRLFPEREVVTRVGGGTERSTYRQMYERCSRLAGALRRLGIKPGDRVGTFAWNSNRHLELYLGVPCSGAVLHTVNIRLFPEQTVYVINDGGSRVLFVDRSLLPALETLRDRLTTVEQFVILDDGPPPDAMLSYETLLAAESPDFEWPVLDERSAAAICYTSGTTGNPKGVVYSHRALTLHTMCIGQHDVLDLGERDTVMPVVPMFHANAWGLPFAATAFGSAQVHPGAAPTPADLMRLIESERVTLAAGVPTIWLNALPLFRGGEYDYSALNRIVCGGSAVPITMAAAYRELGIEMIHAWGMTETTPLVTTARMRREVAPEEEDLYRAKQGVPALGCEVRAIDDEGKDVPWDGESFGEAVVRGPWVTSGYLHTNSGERFTSDGWFRMGDVITIDPLGYIQVVDRTKDLVKSGGEWISSVELENALMGHPDILEAAVIAIPDEKWVERPLACVVVQPDARDRITPEDLIEFLRPNFAPWWLPDAVAFVDEIPKTSVGKFDKKVLRTRHAEGELIPQSRAAAASR